MNSVLTDFTAPADPRKTKLLEDRAKRVAMMSPPPSPVELGWMTAYHNAEAELEKTIISHKDPINDPEDRRAHDEGLNRLRRADADLAKELGPERYAEYKRVTKSGYLELNELKQQLNLSQAHYDELVRLHVEVQQQVGSLRSGPGAKERAQRYLDAIVSIIGEENLHKYPTLFEGLLHYELFRKMPP